MIFKNCTFYNDKFEKQIADLEIQNGLIANIGKLNGKGRDMSGFLLIPGFIDIHIHGCGGADACDAKIESLETMSQELSHHGVTSFCPTTMTLSRNDICSIVSAISDCKPKGAKIAGINLEGPFISKDKKGAQNSNFIRRATIGEFDEIYNKSKEKIKLITIAPETFGSREFIEYASQKCTVSIGHSNADSDTCRAAFDSGARHVTHLYNAMTALGHREEGIVGAALDDERIMCELICDGGHILPSVLRSTFKILGDDRAVVISDSMRGAGLEPGQYELGGQSVFVKEGALFATLSNGTIAASITNLHQEFKNLIAFGIDFKTALKACTINPAKAIKEDSKLGSIKKGKCADLVFLDDDLNIKEVYIDGILA